MPTTPRLGLTYPAGTDNVSAFPALDQANKTLLDNEAAVFLQGTAGAQPAAGVQGRFYFQTDTGLLEYDTGSAWIVPPAAAASIVTSMIADAAVTKAKLATDALNAFLKLASSADIHVDFGAYEPNESFGIASQHVSTIPHSLKDSSGAAKAPSVVLANTSTGISAGSSTDPIICNVVQGSFTPTSFQVRLASLSGGTMNFPSIWVRYIAIG